MGLEAAELTRWKRFAAKGGIGKCTALCDFKAANPDDLMFLKDDEITVLLQIPDKENHYLGFCEGVVGRFCGSDVQFHSKLKKPVMTKRTSISTSSVTNKSPTPPPPSPSVQHHPGSRRGSLSSRRESVSSTTHGRTTPNRPQTLPPSLRSQTSEESDREGKERRGTYAMGMGITVTPPVPQYPHHSNTPSFSYSTSSGPDSALNTPNLGGSFSPPPSALRKLSFNDDSRPGSVTSPPPQGPLPPAPQPQQQQQQHKYITNAPPPLTLASSNQHPSAPSGVKTVTNPLRIMKRSGTLTSGNAGVGVSSPPANVASFGESVAQAQVHPPASSNSPIQPTPHTQTLLVAPPLASSQPLSAPPSTTTTPLIPPSLLNQEPPSKHLSLAKPTSLADAHAGIGMSLLSGLMGDMDSDEDDDSDDGGEILAKAKERMGLGRTVASSPVVRKIVDEDSEDERWSQSSMDPTSLPNSANEAKRALEEEQEEEDRRASWSESGEGTVEGLMYGRDEEEEVTTKVTPVVPPPRRPSSSIIASTTTTSNATSTIPFVNPVYLSPTTSPTTPSFNPSSPPFSIRSRNDSHPHFSSTQPHFSPPVQPYAQLNGERERRPSTATVASVKSSASKATVNTQSSWEGAADIYDDYRYSRYSMTRTSVFGVPPGSVGGGSGSVAGDGSTRNRTDSNSTSHTSSSASNPLSPLTRDRVDSTASAGALNRLAMMQEEEQSPPPSANTFGHMSRVGSVVGSLADSRVGSMGEFGSRIGSGFGAGVDSRGGSMAEFGSRVGSIGTFGGSGSGYNTPMGAGSASPGPGMMNTGGLKVEGEGRDRRSKRASKRHTRRLEGLVGGEADDGEDSDGSVYSKNSRDSRLSIGSLDDAPMSPVLANPAAFASLSSFSSQQPPNSTSTSTTSTSPNPNGTGNIPPPLDLSNKPNPLLHTSFASPGSNTTSPRTSETDAFSPSLATGLSSLNNWTGTEMVMGSVVSGRFGGEENTRGEGGDGPGAGGMGGQSLGGIASRMRMRLEEARVGSPALVSRDASMDEGRSRDTITGLGERIVVEDEEELPSRIEDTVETMDSSMLSMTSELGGGIRGGLMRGVDVRPQSAVVEGGDETVGDISLDALASKPDDSFEPSTPPNRSITLLSTPASPPSVSSTPPQPSHLRPSMRELREGATIPIPGTNQRRSIFLPHPNAPKPPPVEVDESGRERGPMYIVSPGLAPSSGPGSQGPPVGVPASATPPLQTRTPPPGFSGSQGPGSNPHANAPFPPLGPGLPRAPHPSQLPLHPSRPHPHLVGVLKMALSLPPPPARAPSASGPGGAKLLAPVHRGPTIYARFEVDLANSLGPVPVMWSVEPAPARAPGATLPPGMGVGGMPPHSHPHQQAPGQGPPNPVSPPRVASVGSQSSSTNMNPALEQVQQRQSQPAPMRRGSASVMSDSEVMRSRGSVGGGASARMSGGRNGVGGGGSAMGGEGPNATGAGGGNVTSGEETSSKNPIPRANFFPKKPGMRPRSRSFSGFNSTTAEVAMPVQRGSEKAEIPSASEIKRSLTTSSSTSASKLASGAPSPTLPPPTSSPPKSSPLSLSSSSPTSSPLSLNAPATSKPAKSSPLRPSPLSLSTTSADSPMKPPTTFGGLKSPSSPLAKSMFSRDEKDEKQVEKEDESDNEKNKDKEEKPTNTPSPFTSPVLGGRNELRSVTSRSTLNDAVLSRSTPNIAIRPSFDSRPSLPSHPSQGRIGSLQSLPQRRETDPASFLDISATSRPSTDDTRSITVISPPPSTSPTITRQTSLRSKLSLPNLRRNRSRQDDDTLQSPVTPLTPLSITGSYTFASAQAQAQSQGLGLGLGGDSEMLQVQDMEFELVRPSFSLGAARTSEDSGVLGREGSLDLRMGGGGSSAIGAPGSIGGGSAGGGTGSIAGSASNDFLRAESPMSFVSSSAAAETASIAASLAKEKNRGQKEKEAEAANMEAHRARELKWMSLISSFSSTAPNSVAASNSTGANTIGTGGGVSVPTATLTAAQARKSKKVKKLVHEGVPASVRYPVWSFLTDGKARCVPGVYRQLCDREFKRAGVLGDIERDASKILSGIGVEGSVGGRERGMTGDEGDVEARADTREGVVSLLQAYLNMVPDVVYDIGLIHITSTLLLLAPEEDAFWIFVSIMDTHIRPYFSPPPPSTTSTPPSFPVSMALEVDSMLFAKALEHNEPQLARRILNDIGIPKEQLLGGWMRSLFVRALPGEVAVRVWDVFLYEGLPFLMRTALALTSLLKRPILELPPTPQSQRSLLNILFSPASSLIPAPEVFLALAWGVKFKDDDFKKTREKEVKEREKKLDSGRRVANAGGLLGTLGASRGMGISLPRI